MKTPVSLNLALNSFGLRMKFGYYLLSIFPFFGCSPKIGPGLDTKSMNVDTDIPKN